MIPGHREMMQNVVPVIMDVQDFFRLGSFSSAFQDTAVFRRNGGLIEVSLEQFQGSP